MSLVEKARETIAKYQMLAVGDRVVVGVSGGADSVSLLHFLVSLRNEFSLSVVALHLNHGLRGAESDRDENHVKALCLELNVECISESANIIQLAKARGLSLEEAGREARYAFFSRWCSEKNTRIATAHTLNDSVETSLFNFTRGTALRGLCGIPPVRGKIIRPLITCGRAEIEEYCARNGLPYIQDSSNDSDKFSRNRLRRHVLPVLSGINPGFLKNAASSLAALRADADYLDGMASDSLLEIECAGNRFDREKYLALPRPIRFRVLLSLLSRNGLAVDFARLSRLDGMITGGSGAEQLSGSLYLKLYKDFFTLTGPLCRAEYFSVQLQIPEASQIMEIDVFSNKKLLLMNTDYEYYEENIKYTAKPLKNALDCARMNGIATCRQKIPADEIKLAGRGCTKTLKKLFQEAKIPPAERDRLIVLADLDGPVWVEGFGVAERVSVSRHTRQVLILDVKCGGVEHE